MPFERYGPFRCSLFVDHLHEHFVDPCIVVDGTYVLPTRPDYSTEVFASTLAEYSFPDGSSWIGASASSASVSDGVVSSR